MMLGGEHTTSSAAAVRDCMMRGTGSKANGCDARLHMAQGGDGGEDDAHWHVSLKRPTSAEGRLRERTGGLRLGSQEEAGTIECAKRGECAGDDTDRGECRGFTGRV